MKLVLCALISLFAVSQAAVTDPRTLFNNATVFQTRVTSLQQDIVSVITGMRFSLSDILKRTSNETLDQVQNNLQTIFYMEEPTRTELFEGLPTMDPCIVNLRAQLNSVTETSGYQSSNCIRRYDGSVTSLVSDAYSILEEYEGLMAVIQMLVLNAFDNRNIYTKGVEIEEQIITEYNKQFARWEEIQVVIANFLQTLEDDITVFNVILGTCFQNVQEDLQPQYDRLVRQVDICREFAS